MDSQIYNSRASVRSATPAEARLARANLGACKESAMSVSAFINPTYLSVGALCTAGANTWNVLMSQFIGFLFGPAAIEQFSFIVNWGTTFCELIDLTHAMPV